MCTLEHFIPYRRNGRYEIIEWKRIIRETKHEREIMSRELKRSKSGDNMATEDPKYSSGISLIEKLLTNPDA